MKNDSEDTILQYLKQHRKYTNLLRKKGCPQFDTTHVMSDWAVRKGMLKVLAYFEEECEQSIHSMMLCDIAVECGKLDCLKYLISHGHTWNTELVGEAAYHGDIQIVQYLYEQNPEFFHNSDADYLAAENGHLHVVQYLFEQGVAPSSGAAMVLLLEATLIFFSMYMKMDFRSTIRRFNVRSTMVIWNV